jgi:glycosyltransferase involved in cell wall biosynthesis
MPSPTAPPAPLPTLVPSSISPLHLGKMIPPPYAGMEEHVDTLLCALSSEVRCTLVASDTVRHRQTLPAPLPYRVLAARSYGNLASALVSPALLGIVQREFQARRANLLHVHAPNPWGDLAILRMPKNVPTVMTWHSDIVRQRVLLQAYGRYQQRALARVDRVLVFTPAHYSSSEQLRVNELGHKVVHVPIGIDFARLDAPQRDAALQERINKLAKGRRVLLTVGRHVYYKGYGHLLGALSKASADVVLVMIGAGPLTASLQRQVRELGLSNRVLMLGEVSSLSLVTALHRCDFFCLPSIAPSEAFGIATAEAMACGKPALVCELNNGVTYLNQADRTSIVVPPRDEHALADALDLLARDDALRARLGTAARERVRNHFSVQAMRDGTLALYKSLL